MTLTPVLNFPRIRPCRRRTFLRAVCSLPATSPRIFTADLYAREVVAVATGLCQQLSSDRGQFAVFFMSREQALRQIHNFLPGIYQLSWSLGSGARIVMIKRPESLHRSSDDRTSRVEIEGFKYGHLTRMNLLCPSRTLKNGIRGSVSAGSVVRCNAIFSRR